MSEKKRQIFREKSLKKLSSPERLDQLLRIVRPQSWILVFAMIAGLALLIAWSIVGTIPATASGTAILVHPKRVVPFQSPASGQIKSIEVSVGEQVEKGDLLALLHLPVLQKQLEEERAKLELFRRSSTELAGLDREVAVKERELLAERRALFEERIQKVSVDAERAKSKTDSYIAKQRENIATTQRFLEELRESRDEWHQSLVDISTGDEKLVSLDRVLDARSQVIEVQLQLAQNAVEEEGLILVENEAQEDYDSQMDLVSELRIQANQLGLREMEIDRRLREGELTNETDEQEILSRIAQLETQLAEEGRVISEYTGEVWEITTTLGQQLAVGERIGKMEIDDPDAELMALAYFDIKSGKKVEVGMPIRISPSTVERERFGGIKGNVTRVSEFPVTVEAAANEIGDLEIARGLFGGQTRIGVEVHLNLDKSTVTGFEWTSGQGPEDIQITAGTTAEVRVTIEEIAPIKLLLPFLKSLSGS